MADNRQATWTLTARWVFPVAGPPLPKGTVTIAGERILAVEPHGERTADLDLGNAALLPGLVNAHTHLDLSGLRGRVPPSADFTGWLRAVISQRRAQSPQQVETDIRTGLAESLAYGTTLVGDISSQGGSWPVLATAPVRSVVFYELLGLPPDRAAQALAGAKAWLEAHPATATCRPGLSPHAPYSVRHDLFAEAALLACRHDAPLAVHLAETRAELELLRHRRGPFVRFLEELGVWEPGGLAGSPAEVMRLCSAKTATGPLKARVPSPFSDKPPGPKLFIHGNYLSPRARIPSSSTIVYCPRTHAAFDHPPHPWRDFLARGVRVALGTDSLASNPDLDVLAEACYLHRLFPEMPGNVLLSLITLSGAEALGWEEEVGSLEPGKSADLVVLPLPPDDPADPHPLLFASSLAVSGVISRGRWVKSSGGMP